VKGRDHSEELGVDGKIILKWMLGKWSGKVWTRVWTGEGVVAGSCQHSNGTSGSINGGEFLDYLSDS